MKPPGNLRCPPRRTSSAIPAKRGRVSIKSGASPWRSLRSRCRDGAMSGHRTGGRLPLELHGGLALVTCLVSPQARQCGNAVEQTARTRRERTVDLPMDQVPYGGECPRGHVPREELVPLVLRRPDRPRPSARVHGSPARHPAYPHCGNGPHQAEAAVIAGQEFAPPDRAIGPKPVPSNVTPITGSSRPLSAMQLAM